MGFYSQDCKRCGHPALSPRATEEINAWMSEVVTISASGEIHAGTYDGYGSVGGAEYAVGDNNTVYHRACWEVLGRPLEYAGRSEFSPDQGWFFDDGAHDLADPRILAEGET